jgi:hypothetical protein
LVNILSTFLDDSTYKYNIVSRTSDAGIRRNEQHTTERSPIIKSMPKTGPI